MKEIKLEIPYTVDREAMVCALANSGYLTKVTRGRDSEGEETYYVIFKMEK
jgi:hypothetical protein